MEFDFLHSYIALIKMMIFEGYDKLVNNKKPLMNILSSSNNNTEDTFAKKTL